MPDCDKFERRIGKPWRKPYRLACGSVSSPDQDLVDEVLRAALQDIQGKFDCPSLPDFRDAILDALTQQLRLPFGSTKSSSLDSRQHLNRRLEELQTKAGNSLGAQTLVKAAKLVFDELQSANGPVRDEQVDDRLSERFLCLVVDNSFLDCGRDGLIKATGRTLAEQDKWATDMKNHVAQQAPRLLEPLLKGEGSKPKGPLRRPRDGSRMWKKGDLQEPMPVVER